MKPHKLFLIGAVLIGAALFYIRYLSFSFARGTTTPEHPYIIFTAVLIIANLIWLCFIPILKRWSQKDENNDRSWRVWIWGLIGLSLGFRALFFGSVPIYEDDFNRYLWDGASIAQGVSPYKYSPTEILDQLANETLPEGQIPIPAQDGKRLLKLSDEGYSLLLKINNPDLTTIYPPSAQAAFAIAAIIKPLDLNSLRLVFLFIEALTMFLLIKALALYGRSSLWTLLYAFNPLLIYSAFNVAHMDVVLPPFIIAALILIKKRPYMAAIAVAGAAAVKVWPLILAPIFYRGWLRRPLIYISCAILVAALSLMLFWPMLTELRPSSGLSAYTQTWQRSSFLFPAFSRFLEGFMTEPSQFLRYCVAGILTGLSLWFGFKHLLEQNTSSPENNILQDRLHMAMPRALMILTLTLIFLSPTGYPWYVIWVIMFMPFIPYYGAALLCALVPLYYVRFALGEQGRYEIYTSWLVPIQFGLPMLILLGEYCFGQIKGVMTKNDQIHA
ncbi:MAG: hypothetical protein ABJG88_13295 [Litorimonas sp.]